VDGAVSAAGCLAAAERIIAASALRTAATRHSEADALQAAAQRQLQRRHALEEKWARAVTEEENATCARGAHLAAVAQSPESQNFSHILEEMLQRQRRAAATASGDADSRRRGSTSLLEPRPGQFAPSAANAGTADYIGHFARYHQR
jgi:hypothetical protein